MKRPTGWREKVLSSLETEQGRFIFGKTRASTVLSPSLTGVKNKTAGWTVAIKSEVWWPLPELPHWSGDSWSPWVRPLSRRPQMARTWPRAPRAPRGSSPQVPAPRGLVPRGRAHASPGSCRPSRWAVCAARNLQGVPITPKAFSCCFEIPPTPVPRRPLVCFLSLD